LHRLAPSYVEPASSEKIQEGDQERTSGCREASPELRFRAEGTHQRIEFGFRAETSYQLTNWARFRAETAE
jgi:hypothetical protein